MASQLITSDFKRQALAFPDRVDAALAEITDVNTVKRTLDQALAFQTYAERLRSGIEIEKPIAIGVLKIKAKLGELMPAKPPQERGRGKKNSSAAEPFFGKESAAAYRKIAKHKDKLEKYCKEVDDVPSQAGFLSSLDKPHQAKTSGKIEWYTPEPYVKAARQVMGGIDLDPASCSAAQKTIRARRYFTVEDDGLSHPWKGNVWLNPPYAAQTIDKFIDKLIVEHVANRITQAIVLVNNATDTSWFRLLVDSANVLCFTTGRIAFIDANGLPVSGATQGQAFAYFGKRSARFAKTFRQFGWMVVPYE